MEKVIIRKFGEEVRAWCSRSVWDGYGVGVWKVIRNKWEAIKSNACFIVGNGKRVKFWK